MRSDWKQIAKDLGVKMVPDTIQPGDMYLAERNTGPGLLTCKAIKDGYIITASIDYCYDVGECIKVVLL